MSGHDVIVSGGGIAGFSAAIGAARCGARVLLLEKYGFLGGVATSSNVLAFCGLYQSGSDTPVRAVSGANDLLFDELRSLGMTTDPVSNPNTGNWLVHLEPERLKLAMDRCLKASGVEVLLHARIIDATGDTSQLQSVEVAAHEGRRVYEASAFVDATGDAHVARAAFPDAEAAGSRKTLQPYSAPIRIGGLPEGLHIDRDALIEQVRRYNETGRYPIHRERGGFFARIPASTDIWWMVIDHPCVAATSAELSEAERHAREAAQDYIALLRKVQPETRNARLVQTGPQIGIRESWHPTTHEEVSSEDLLSGRLREDGIARAAWPLEDHAIIGKPVFTRLGSPGYAHIPFGAIRSDRADNLFFAGRTIGANPLAYTSVRVMGTAFATGLAAGVAAASPDAKPATISAKIQACGGMI